MNVPAVAQKTFEKLQNQIEFVGIVKFVLDRLKKTPKLRQRVKFVHGMVDEFNREVFSHPLVQELSPCKMGCTGCCHTQLSVTEDEALLLAERINNGLKIDLDRLMVQTTAKNNSADYYKLSYQDRKCVFLNEAGACQVYDDRPSVCRTNAVLGEASQCDTSVSVQPTRLVLTQKSDMVIYASFLFAKSSGTLPYMIHQYIRPSKK